MKDDLLQEPRPMFKGEYKLNKVNNKIEPHYSDFKRTLFRYLVTFPTLVVVIFMTVVIMLKFFELQSLFEYATSNGIFPRKFF